MQHYRVYAMDRSGRIAFAHDMLCQGDRDAVAEAERQPGAHGIEVWQGSRLVWRITPQKNLPLPVTQENISQSASGMIRNFGARSGAMADILARKFHGAGDALGEKTWLEIARIIRRMATEGQS